jgi:hypothetical protein
MRKNTCAPESTSMHYTSTPLLSPLRYFCTPALPTEHKISMCDLDAIYPLRSRAPHTLMVDSRTHRPLCQPVCRCPTTSCLGRAWYEPSHIGVMNKQPTRRTSLILGMPTLASPPCSSDCSRVQCGRTKHLVHCRLFNTFLGTLGMRTSRFNSAQVALTP